MGQKSLTIAVIYLAGSLWASGTVCLKNALKSLARAKEFSWKRCGQDTMNAYKTALGQAKG